MKREMAAAALLLTLFGASFLNLRYLRGFTGELAGTVESSRAAFEDADYGRAEALLRGALSSWEGAEGYTHIFIRHSEIDSTADAFYELREVLLAEELEGCDAAYGKLRYHIISIQEMEHPRLGSIL